MHIGFGDSGHIALGWWQQPRLARGKRLRDRLAGHFWTIAPALKAALMPQPAPAAEPFRAVVDDPLLGPVQLNGWLSEVPGSETLALIVHGLAGNADSHYCLAAARAARRAGFSSLRLSLRGADGSGEDIYHGGLVEDLKAALASASLVRYRRVFLVGYSFGGHVALRAAIEKIDPRLQAVAAICPPLDLKATMKACDAPGRRLYRRSINSALNKNYERVAARRKLPTPVSILKRARTCDEWNALAIVPRFGFASLEDYYERASVAADIHRLQLPALIVASENDPIVRPEDVRPALSGASPSLTVQWVRQGGHVHFPSDLDLKQGGPLGLEAQVYSWLGRQQPDSACSSGREKV
jgi:predicted alpha/beta-fold hydrolase